MNFLTAQDLLDFLEFADIELVSAQRRLIRQQWEIANLHKEIEELLKVKSLVTFGEL